MLRGWRTIVPLSTLLDSPIRTNTSLGSQPVRAGDGRGGWGASPALSLAVATQRLEGRSRPNPNPLRADKVDMNTNNNPRPPYDDDYPDDGDPSEYRCFCPSRKECDC